MAKRGLKTKVGRKIFDGKNEKEVIPKLEQVWSIGGTDKEACFYAEISPPALCRYLQKHPVILERKEALLQKPILKARQELVKGLDGDPELALKYLERKLPKEFAVQQRLEHFGLHEGAIRIVYEPVKRDKS